MFLCFYVWCHSAVWCIINRPTIIHYNVTVLCHLCCNGRKPANRFSLRICWIRTCAQSQTEVSAGKCVKVAAMRACAASITDWNVDITRSFGGCCIFMKMFVLFLSLFLSHGLHSCSDHQILCQRPPCSLQCLNVTSRLLGNNCGDK